MRLSQVDLQVHTNAVAKAIPATSAVSHPPPPRGKATRNNIAEADLWTGGRSVTVCSYLCRRDCQVTYLGLRLVRARGPLNDVVSDDEMRQWLAFENHAAQPIDGRIAARSRKLAGVINQHDVSRNRVLEQDDRRRRNEAAAPMPFPVHTLLGKRAYPRQHRERAPERQQIRSTFRPQARTLTPSQKFACGTGSTPG